LTQNLRLNGASVLLKFAFQACWGSDLVVSTTYMDYSEDIISEEARRGYAAFEVFHKQRNECIVLRYLLSGGHRLPP
jgi:hypothetical protein